MPMAGYWPGPPGLTDGYAVRRAIGVCLMLRSQDDGIINGCCGPVLALLLPGPEVSHERD